MNHAASSNAADSRIVHQSDWVTVVVRTPKPTEIHRLTVVQGTDARPAERDAAVAEPISAGRAFRS